MVVLGPVNDISRAGAQAGQAARRLSDHPWLERLARIGFAASGLIHLMIGWVAARIALGGDGEADQGGALQEVRDAPFGEVLLWGAVLGFGALALFQLLEGLVGGVELKDRVTALSRAGLYAVLGGTAFVVARGGSTDGEETTTDVTATLMGAPLGQLLVGAVALVIVGSLAADAMIGDAKTITDIFLMLVVVLLWDYLLNLLEYHFPGFRKIAQDSPTLLIHNGKILKENLRREKDE